MQTMNKLPVISVIIAVYNAENYIRRCLDSIRNQTYIDFEVLLIDDGSIDRSGEICEEYTREDSRFKVIHKENGGVGSARQCGIDHAMGIFSIHIDSDDWIEPDMLYVMIKNANENKSDICCCGYYLECDNCRKIVNFEGERKHNDILKYGLGLWNKLLRTELYKKNNLSFRSNLFVFEDVYILLNLNLLNLKVSSVDKPLYHYDMHSNSDSLSKKSIKRIELLKLMRILRKEGTFRINRNRIYSLLTDVANEDYELNRLTYLEFLKFYLKYSICMLTSKSPVWRKINVISQFIGLSMVSRPLYKFLKYNTKRIIYRQRKAEA